MITIRTEKLVKKGVAFRKILEIKAITYEELPSEYIGGYPYCYKRDDGKELYVVSNWHRSLFVDNNYKESFFQEMLETITTCGKRLQEINVKVKELEKNWVGEETFYI